VDDDDDVVVVDDDDVIYMFPTPLTWRGDGRRE
jgi:hypothetical protein